MEKIARASTWERPLTALQQSKIPSDVFEQLKWAGWHLQPTGICNGIHPGACARVKKLS
jgi:hypothetical protein